VTKRDTTTVKVNNEGLERLFRENLSKKICGTLVGLWFLAAEHLRLGNWDLIKGYTGCTDADIEPRIAMQIVNEAALCSNRVRRSNYISHQGFELLNGLGFLVTDEQVHGLLDKHTISEAQSLQETLAIIRSNNGHYKGDLIAIDPHRIVSTSQRIMPKKKKQPEEPSRKMLQTFFALDTHTGQPIGCGIGSPGVNTSKATIDLLNMVGLVNKNALILADKEHFTEYLIRSIDQNSDFEFLVPVTSTERIQKIERSQTYQSKWAGYAIAESMFNFDGAMGFDRASTFNLNIRYGKMSLALLTQAATYQFRQKLPEPYKRWNSTHLAEAVFAKTDGDIRVKDDTIIITCYNAPKELNLHNHYQSLPTKLISEGINPKVPWLYNYKLDFRFK